MRDEAPDQARSRPQRICFVLETAHLAFDRRPRVGGAEIQVRIVAEKLAALGHEVYVASGEAFEHPRIRTLDSRRLLRALRRTWPEVVVATVATKTSIKAGLVSRLLGIDFLYRLSHDCESRLEIDRETSGDPLRRLLFRLMLELLTKSIWCQHEGQKANLEARGLAGKLFVAANVSPDRRLANPAPRETVLWVGRYFNVKRPGLFVRVARRLPGRRCVMIVPGAPATFRRSLGEVENLDLIDYVPPEELPAHYAAARVLVNTSSSEGLPNTFIEAACQGTPIVAIGVDPGGLFARFGHGQVIADPAAAARRIDELFANAEDFERLSANARRYFEEVHEIERAFPRILAGITSSRGRGEDAR